MWWAVRNHLAQVKSEDYLKVGPKNVAKVYIVFCRQGPTDMRLRYAHHRCTVVSSSVSFDESSVDAAGESPEDLGESIVSQGRCDGISGLIRYPVQF